MNLLSSGTVGMVAWNMQTLLQNGCETRFPETSDVWLSAKFCMWHQSHYIKVAQGGHSAYRWNIMYQKCAGMGLNGLIIQKINENWNDREKKNPGSGLEVLQYF